MIIVTLMDFQSEPYLTMCKSWLYLAKRFHPEAKIYIGYDHDISDIKKFADRYQDVHFLRLSVAAVRKLHLNKGLVDHPAQELQLALWQALEKLKVHTFLYIDADAFIVSNLDEWWEVIKEKPCISVPQKYEAGKPLFNMGVFSYHSDDKFISLKKLVNQYQKDGGINISLGEQGLVNAYFRAIKYSPAHKRIGISYNCFTKNCTVAMVNETEIVVYSGAYPRLLWLYKKFVGTLEWWEEWLGWNRSQNVKVLHGYGKEFKFWMLPECQKLWEFCKNQVS